jgi:heme-degrading monooxygenase HmoA
MVLEVAVLDVRPNEEANFERAIRVARPLIAATHGFRGMEIRRCIEDPQRYLLLVKWDSIEDHTVGFRQSERYDEWRRLLHHFYDPFPTVEHYEEPVDLGATG